MLDLLEGLVGAPACSHISPHRFDQPNAAIAMRGKLLNTSAELTTADVIQSDTFKSTITGEPIPGKILYNDMYQHLFHDTQTAILVFDDKAKMANYSTAQLGNALRDVVLKSRRSYEPQVRGILGPLEERLSELIREDDRATLAGAQKIGHSLSDNQ